MYGSPVKDWKDVDFVHSQKKKGFFRSKQNQILFPTYSKYYKKMFFSGLEFQLHSFQVTSRSIGMTNAPSLKKKEK